jgi:hypothetical protein
MLKELNKIKKVVDRIKSRCYNKVTKLIEKTKREVNKMKRTNVEIARMVESKGYSFTEALESIDAGRTPKDEKKEITQEEINEMVEAICSSFEIDVEE